MATPEHQTEAAGGLSAVDRLVMRLARWWRGFYIPSGPQPCPHCGVALEAAWVEGSGDSERFFVRHADPVCFAGSKRLEIFPLTEREVRAFRFWTHNAELTGASGAFAAKRPR